MLIRIIQQESLVLYKSFNTLFAVGGGGGGAKSYDAKKACSSINHSVPSGNSIVDQNLTQVALIDRTEQHRNFVQYGLEKRRLTARIWH
jgi:hypothetical protein